MYLLIGRLTKNYTHTVILTLCRTVCFQNCHTPCSAALYQLPHLGCSDSMQCNLIISMFRLHAMQHVISLLSLHAVQCDTSGLSLQVVQCDISMPKFHLVHHDTSTLLNTEFNAAWYQHGQTPFSVAWYLSVLRLHAVQPIMIMLSRAALYQCFPWSASWY